MTNMGNHITRTAITDHYLSALGLQKRKPDLVFLNEIIRSHVAKFAFSSVGPQLGDELPLDFESLYQRIVVRRRGGYCFEQNGLLFELLKELGFSVSLYLGRVIYNKDVHPGLTHRISLVEIDENRYVADVGFGPLGPSRAVSMSGKDSNEGFRVFRVAERLPGEFHLQALKDGRYFSLYKFELVRYGQADCEVGHFYSHKHPGASFVNHLVVSRILDHEILSLRNHQFSVINQSGEQRSQIDSCAQLHSTLEERFKLNVSSNESEQLFAGSVECRLKDDAGNRVD
jgi:N-hydroxyarylamine O-acetyltransferase